MRSTCWAARRSQDGFFFHALDPMDGGQAVAFGQQGQTFNDRLLGVVPAIEHGSDRLDKGAVTSATLIAMGTYLGYATPTAVRELDLTIIDTVWIPADC